MSISENYQNAYRDMLERIKKMSPEELYIAYIACNPTDVWYDASNQITLDDWIREILANACNRRLPWVHCSDIV